MGEATTCLSCGPRESLGQADANAFPRGWFVLHHLYGALVQFIPCLPCAKSRTSRPSPHLWPPRSSPCPFILCPLPSTLTSLIVGAGLSASGPPTICKRAAGQVFALLEAREASGGTWDLFRYPGIRSDSDLHTFGYEFKPWVNDKAIADAGPSSPTCVRRPPSTASTADSLSPQGGERHWSSQAQRWTVEVEVQGTSARKTFTCQWLFSAAGYYRYDEGFSPRFEGRSASRGRSFTRSTGPKNWTTVTSACWSSAVVPQP